MLLKLVNGALGRQTKKILTYHAHPTLKSKKLEYSQHDNDPKHAERTVTQYPNGKR